MFKINFPRDLRQAKLIFTLFALRDLLQSHTAFSSRAAGRVGGRLSLAASALGGGDGGGAEQWADSGRGLTGVEVARFMAPH